MVECQGGYFSFGGYRYISGSATAVHKMPAATCLPVQALAEVEEGKRTAWVMGHADGNGNHFLPQLLSYTALGYMKLLAPAEFEC